jgi:hypothetical protein
MTFYGAHSDSNISISDNSGNAVELLVVLQDTLESSKFEEIQVECLGVLANLIRFLQIDEAINLPRKLASLLVDLLQANSACILLPLCGVWTNLLHFNSPNASTLKEPQNLER